jgi:hypothetical protein
MKKANLSLITYNLKNVFSLYEPIFVSCAGHYRLVQKLHFAYQNQPDYSTISLTGKSIW